MTATLAACGGAPQDRAFPSQAELKKIASSPPPALPERAVVPLVDTWALSGPFPEAPDGPASNEAPGALLMTGPSGGAKATAAMQCAARELARFVAQHEGGVPDALRAFIAVRCGSTAANLNMSWINGEVGPDESPHTVLDRWAPAPADKVEATHDALGEGGAFGAAFAQHDDHAVWMVVGQAASAGLDDFTGLPDADGFVSVEGRANPRYHTMSALVTRGRFGFDVCTPRRAPTGRYAFGCPVEPTDEIGQIEVLGVPTGSILGDVVARVTIWPTGRPIDVWRSATGLEARPVGAAEDVPRAMLTAVNQLRDEAGATPLVLDVKQTGELTALAPHYWSAIWNQDRPLADRVALGVLAGWQVAGPVRQGRFAAADTDNRPDVALLLQGMLGSPFHRRMLFDPSTRRLAVGAMLVSGQRLMALVGGYAVFETASFDPAEAAGVVRRQFDAERARNDRAPLERWAMVEAEMAPIVAAMNAGTVEPEAALNQAMRAATRVAKTSVTGYVVRTSDLSQLTLPSQLTNDGSMPVAIAVGYNRKTGHPWTQDVVLLVWPQTVVSATPTATPGSAGLPISGAWVP